MRLTLCVRAGGLWRRHLENKIYVEQVLAYLEEERLGMFFALFRGGLEYATHVAATGWNGRAL